MKDIINIKEKFQVLQEATIEKNGSYIYVLNQGKRTNLKAPINDETINIQSAVELVAYMFRCMQLPRTRVVKKQG